MTVLLTFIPLYFTFISACSVQESLNPVLHWDPILQIQPIFPTSVTPLLDTHTLKTPCVVVSLCFTAKIHFWNVFYLKVFCTLFWINQQLSLINNKLSFDIRAILNYLENTNTLKNLTECCVSHIVTIMWHLWRQWFVNLCSIQSNGC